MGKATKPWWKSKGVIGSVGAFLACMIPLLPLDAGTETHITGMVLAAIALWGRLAAGSKVTVRKPKLEVED